MLLSTSEYEFTRLVPYLMLGATLIFSFAGKLRSTAASHAAQAAHFFPLVGGQFLISFYGGYFGAGMGVLMLALYLLAANLDMHQASGVRLLCGTTANTVATLVFATRGIIQWPLGVPMIFACAAGGYWGAHMVKRMDPERARYVILVYAWAVTVWLLVRSLCMAPPELHWNLPEEALDRELAHHEALYSGFAQQHFAKAAVRALREHMVRRILRVTGAGKTSRVLSLGCGIGDTELLLAPRVASLTGIDLSPSAIRQARADAEQAVAANTEFLEATVNSASLLGRSFDVIIGVFFLHHVPDAELPLDDRANSQLA